MRPAATPFCHHGDLLLPLPETRHGSPGICVQRPSCPGGTADLSSGTGPSTKERTQDFVLSWPAPGMPLIPITCQKPCGITGIRKNGRNGFKVEKWILSFFMKPMMIRRQLFSWPALHLWASLIKQRSMIRGILKISGRKAWSCNDYWDMGRI